VGDSFSGQETNLSPQQLQALVARIAIYPDDLLGLVLTASTQPLEIVEAERFLEMRKAQPMVKVQKSWDPSVIALLNYPDVIALMDSDITWTEQLGTSVTLQRAAVLDAIQSFRRQTYNAGNLRSNDRMTVTVSPDGTTQNETVAISPASPQTIYVPIYDPAAVLAQAPTDDWSAYDWSQPYPYYADSNAIFFPDLWYGGFIGFGFGWHSHQIFRGDRHWDRNRDHDHDHGDVGWNADGRSRLAPGVSISGRSIWQPGRRVARQMPASIRRDLAGMRPATGAGPGDPPLPTVVRPMPQIAHGVSRVSGPSSVQVLRGPPIIHNDVAMPLHSRAEPRFAGGHVAAPLSAPRSSMAARPNYSGRGMGMVHNGFGGGAGSSHR
jgi:hypothetical protein